jgi:hypothetical protein
MEAAEVAQFRRWCPYGREVAEAVARATQQRARLPDVLLYAGPDAWERAKHRREGLGPGHALVLPPGADPATLRWPAIPCGLVVDARGVPREVGVALGRVLVTDGTPYACIVLADNTSASFRRAGWEPPTWPAHPESEPGAA